MKSVKITVHYNVKRVSHYQSAEVGAVVEVELAPGESAEAAFTQAMQTLIPLVEDEADKGIRQAVYLDSQGGR